MASDAIKTLAELLKDSGAVMCFCTLCNHDRSYGYCFVCRCHNHGEAPEMTPDLEKAMAALDHLKRLYKEVCKDRAVNNSK